jgi:hypothetical protein
MAPRFTPVLAETSLLAYETLFFFSVHVTRRWDCTFIALTCGAEIAESTRMSQYTSLSNRVIRSRESM